MKIKIANDEITECIVGKIEEFPKYTTQILNLANQNAQGTRPSVVGQMSDLIQECPSRNYEDWVTWYQETMPNAIDKATERVFDMVQNLKEAIQLIDKPLIRRWVQDLILTKTFVGLRFQEIILQKIAALKNEAYRLASSEEESKGIDGYIGKIPVSIKPTTYTAKPMLPEHIEIKMIFYEKTKTGLTIDFDF